MAVSRSKDQGSAVKFVLTIDPSFFITQVLSALEMIVHSSVAQGCQFFKTNFPCLTSAKFNKNF